MIQTYDFTKLKRNPSTQNTNYQSTYLINSTDRVASTASKFADCAAFWLLLRGFPGWILWQGVGLHSTQWEPLAQWHSQRVKWRWGAKLAEMVGGFWGALCPVRLIQGCMCPPDSHHSSANSIHHWRCHPDWACLQEGIWEKAEWQSIYQRKVSLIVALKICISLALHRCEENNFLQQTSSWQQFWII